MERNYFLMEKRKHSGKSRATERGAVCLMEISSFVCMCSFRSDYRMVTFFFDTAKCCNLVGGHFVCLIKPSSGSKMSQSLCPDVPGVI